MLGGIIEKLGLGAAGDANALVARLPSSGLAVAAIGEVLVRALARGGHRLAMLDGESAEAAIALDLPEGDEAYGILERLTRATRVDGTLIVASTSARSQDRARIAGLLLRAGLVALRQDLDGSTVYTSAQVGERL